MYINCQLWLYTFWRTHSSTILSNFTFLSLRTEFFSVQCFLSAVGVKELTSLSILSSLFEGAMVGVTIPYSRWRWWWWWWWLWWWWWWSWWWSSSWPSSWSRLWWLWWLWLWDGEEGSHLYENPLSRIRPALSHISIKSSWYLLNQVFAQPYQDYFIKLFFCILKWKVIYPSIENILYLCLTTNAVPSISSLHAFVSSKHLKERSRVCCWSPLSAEGVKQLWRSLS